MHLENMGVSQLMKFMIICRMSLDFLLAIYRHLLQASY